MGVGCQQAPDLQFLEIPNAVPEDVVIERSDGSGTRSWTLIQRDVSSDLRSIDEINILSFIEVLDRGHVSTSVDAQGK